MIALLKALTLGDSRYAKGGYDPSHGLNHVVHYRGQLSVFLPVLDVPVPGMYGPSADER